MGIYRALIITGLIAVASADISAEIEKAIRPYAQSVSETYKCAVSIAVYKGDPVDGFAATAVGGVIDGCSPAGCTEEGTATDPSDKFVWGSVTKVLTGTGILRLVSKGVLKLSDTIPQYIDPFIRKMKEVNPSQNFSSLDDLFGPETAKVTIEDLLGMKSGIPDYDTASPSGKAPSDYFRQVAYDNPTKSYIPADMLNVPWCHTGKLLFPPGKCDTAKYGNCYASTNFVLLGMILAGQADAGDWDLFNQDSILKEVIGDFNPPMAYALHGPPVNWTNVKGYDTTHYNNNTHPIDVSHVAGVFAGWTASDLVASPTNIARMAYDVYAPPYKLVSEEYVELMYNSSSLTGYGLATFNLTRRTGQSGPDGVAWGHLGATYGYDSIVAYNPTLNFALAIATNIETDGQAQPAEAMCHVYNAVRAVIRGIPAPKCTFTPGFWSGGCHCVD